MGPLAHLFHGSSHTLDSFLARRRFARCPDSLEGAYDFVAPFRFRSVVLAPFQIREEMLALLHRLASDPPRKIVELGTGRGGTLFLFTRVAADDALIVTVDLPDAPFGGGYLRSRVPLLKSFARADQTIRLVRADTHDIATVGRIRSLAAPPIDLLFIDGDHTYQGVRQDFEAYSRLVRPGGLVVFHDIVDGPPDAVGGVPELWREVKSLGRSEEIVADWGQGGYGIGVLTIA